jgi:hypothetical protein
MRVRGLLTSHSADDLNALEQADHSDDQAERSHVKVERVSAIVVESPQLDKPDSDENRVGGRIGERDPKRESLSLREPIVIATQPAHAGSIARIRIGS